jgi:hypothetical protein
MLDASCWRLHENPNHYRRCRCRQVIARAKLGTDLKTTVVRGRAAGGTSFLRTIQTDDTGRSMLEQWVLQGAGHARSGGSPQGCTPIHADQMPAGKWSASSFSTRLGLEVCELIGRRRRTPPPDRRQPDPMAVRAALLSGFAAAGGLHPGYHLRRGCRGVWQRRE